MDNLITGIIILKHPAQSLRELESLQALSFPPILSIKCSQGIYYCKFAYISIIKNTKRSCVCKQPRFKQAVSQLPQAWQHLGCWQIEHSNYKLFPVMFLTNIIMSQVPFGALHLISGSCLIYPKEHQAKNWEHYFSR